MSNNPSVFFVIPAKGRPKTSRISFEGLAWATATLRSRGIDAGAVVVADDDNLALAQRFGFQTLERPNDPLGMKWNDGFQYACELGADFVVSCGSDDWVHPDLIEAQLAKAPSSLSSAIFCSRYSAVVAPDGQQATTIRVRYDGGDGVRMLPRRMLEPFGFRPYLDSRSRALDGGMQRRFVDAGVRVTWTYVDLFPFQIVDFKTDDNLTPYHRFPTCEHSPRVVARPFDVMRDFYPDWLVDSASRACAVEVPA